MKRLLATGAVCMASATAALSLAACSSSSSETPAEKASKASAQMCTDLNTLKADNAKLKALNPANATKDQIKSAVDAVQTDWSNVKEEATALATARRDEVKSAAENLKKAYQDLPGDTTGKDALAKIQPQIQGLDQAIASASSNLHC
ncbi:hypothetical protein ACWCP6_30155 [Streptomyces sp. NPDC002004]